VNRHGCDRFAGNYTQILTIDRPAVIDLHRHGNESHVRRYELTRHAGTHRAVPSATPRLVEVLLGSASAPAIAAARGLFLHERLVRRLLSIGQDGQDLRVDLGAQRLHLRPHRGPVAARVLE